MQEFKLRSASGHMNKHLKSTGSLDYCTQKPAQQEMTLFRDGGEGAEGEN